MHSARGRFSRVVSVNERSSPDSLGCCVLSERNGQAVLLHQARFVHAGIKTERQGLNYHVYLVKTERQGLNYHVYLDWKLLEQ